MKNLIRSALFQLPVVAFTLACDVAFSAKAYVLNDPVANVIDTSTNTVVATIQFFGAALTDEAITVLPNCKFVYVASFSGGFVRVIDTSTNTVIATITFPALGGESLFLAPTPNSQFVYVTESQNDRVSIIDTSTQMITVTIGLPLGSGPDAIAVAPNGQFVYVGNGTTSTVNVINTTTNMITGTITGFDMPLAIAFTPDSQFAYVTNDGATNAVSVVNTTTLAIVATIPVGMFPQSIAITPNGNFAYVGNINDNSVSVIDTSSKSVIATVPVMAPFDLAVTPDSQFVYVTEAPSEVAIINTSTNTVTATIELVPMMNPPTGIAIAPCVLLPPLNLECEQKKNDFGVCYELFNKLKWEANPSGIAAVGYILFRNGDKIATLGPFTFKYEDHNIKKGKNFTYSLFAVDALGNLSDPITIRGCDDD